MIEFNFNTDFALREEEKYTDWIKKVARSEGFDLGDLCYVFVGDEDLLEMNKKYLQHDYYTDIITFDYTVEKELNGDVYISVDRVVENAKEFGVKADEELRRVMVHGVLHLMGYRDKSKEEKRLMRELEDNKIKMFHVEQ